MNVVVKYLNEIVWQPFWPCQQEQSCVPCFCIQHCAFTPVHKTGVIPRCHMPHAWPQGSLVVNDCYVTHLLAQTFRALELFVATNKRIQTRFKHVSGAPRMWWQDSDESKLHETAEKPRGRHGQCDKRGVLTLALVSDCSSIRIEPEFRHPHLEMENTRPWTTQPRTSWPGLQSPNGLPSPWRLRKLGRKRRPCLPVSFHWQRQGPLQQN